MRTLDKNGIYKHYKRGTSYRILTLAIDTQNEKPVVVYQDIDAPEKIWTRPLDMFLESVNDDGVMKERFALIRR